MPRVFRFSHAWQVPASPSRLFEVLRDAEHYDRWWPQVRRVRAVDASSGLVEVRSVLPFTLRLHLVRVLVDPTSRHLRVAIHGDLEGWARWVIRPGDLHTDDDPGNHRSAAGPLSVADFTQEVVLAHPSLAHVAWVASPVLWLNHAWMMSSGRRGLVAHLAVSDSPPQS